MIEWMRKVPHATPPLVTRALVLAALANAMVGLAGALFVHFPGFLQQLGAGEAHIGRIMAAQALGAILAWPLVGRAMDARGRRVVILAGVALFAGVVGLYLSIDALGPGVYAVRLLDGIATTMWYTALFTYAADLVPEQRRTEGLALFGVSGLVPVGLGAQLGDVILAHATYRELFLAALGSAVFGLIVCLPLREVRPVHGGQRVPPRSVVATSVQRDLLPVWLAALTFFIAVLALFTFMKTFVIATGTGSVGGFFSGYAAMAVALRIFLGWLPDRLGARRMLGVAMSCYAFGFVALSLAHTPAHLLAAGLLCGAGHGYAFPVLLSLVVTRARPQERGVATAFFTALDWLGLLLAGPVVGYVIERAGYGTAFMGLALLLAVGIGGFYGLDRGRPDGIDFDEGDGMLISLGGLPGVGKTTIARELARQIAAVHLRIDSIEQAIRDSAILPPSRELDDAGYRAAYAVAEDNLTLGHTVIADCVNPIPLTRNAWLDTARRAGVKAIEVEITCSDPAEHRRRVEARTATVRGLGLPTWQEVVDRDYRGWDRERIAIDTAHRTVEQAVTLLRDALAIS